MQASLVGMQFCSAKQTLRSVSQAACLPSALQSPCGILSLCPGVVKRLETSGPPSICPFFGRTQLGSQGVKGVSPLISLLFQLILLSSRFMFFFLFLFSHNSLMRSGGVFVIKAVAVHLNIVNAQGVYINNSFMRTLFYARQQIMVSDNLVEPPVCYSENCLPHLLIWFYVLQID